MGIIGSLRGLLSGSGKTAQPVLLEEGESELDRVVACTVRGGGRAWVGGDLVLTDRRVLFTPLNVNDVAALLSYGLRRVGAPAGAAAVVGFIARKVAREAAEVSGVVRVAPGRAPGLFNPPTAVFQLDDGRQLEFGILASRTSPNSSTGNVVARDRFLAEVQSQL